MSPSFFFVEDWRDSQLFHVEQTVFVALMESMFPEGYEILHPIAGDVPL